MLRRRAVAAFLVVAGLIGAAAAPALAADRPHVVLVMADDQGWGDVGYNGHSTLWTPNLDAASAAGLRFDRFYAAAPVCSPTRGSVMTGRHPNRYGVFQWGHPLRSQETTLAEALRAAGYATGHFGKWHLGSVRRKSGAHPGIHGFEEWLSAPNFFDNDPILSHRGRAIPMQGESSVVTATAALEWIRERAEDDRPFLAVVWFGSPHSPHVAAGEDRARYADQPEGMRDFLGEITGIDRAFGVLREGLEELGIREDTLLWYTSDNGALPNRGSTGGRRGAKGDVYDGGLMVPAFLEWPRRLGAPRVTDYRAYTSDIFPTLLKIAGAIPEAGVPLDGVSLVPVIEDRISVRSEPMGFWDRDAPGIRTPSAELMSELLAAQESGGDLAAYPASRRPDRLPDPPHPTDRFPGHAAWIDGDWKLHRIERDRGGVVWELYDLAADPEESHDRLAEERERVRSMREPLMSWLESVVRSLNGEDYRGGS